MSERRADERKLERTSVPGVYRRHADGCQRKRGCGCPYVVRWRERGTSRKQMFATFDMAREFKASLNAGQRPRRPLASQTLQDYFESWLESYRGRTARGLEESTRREYRTSFRFHILPLAIAHVRMRDLGAPDVRDWLRDLEGRGASPTTIRKAKAALSVMLATAVEDGDLAFNPATGVRYVPSEHAKRQHAKPRRRQLTGADVVAILNAMPEQWRAFFTLLAQTGARIGELLGLTWRNVYLGDDPHILIEEQFYRGARKRLKTNASQARVPLSPAMAAWLTELRPAEVRADAPVFASKTGTELTYSNMYNRVLRPALRASGIAVNVGSAQEPKWDYQGVAFHAFRKACGSLLLAQGKNLKQVQGWLRHAQLTTTLNVYIHDVDDGLGGAEAWDELLPGSGPLRGHFGATSVPQTDAERVGASGAENRSPAGKTADER